MNPETETTPSAEELQSEQESLAEVKDDDLRSSVVSSLGLEDNETNKGTIDKVVEMRKEMHGKLSKAISQKIKFRDQLKGFTPKPPEANKTNATDVSKQTEATITERFNEEFLEDSEFSDNLKAEIRKISKLNGVTARTATKDSYIKHLIEKETAEKRALEAASNGNGAGKNGQDGGDSMPAKFNDPKFMITEQGQKEYAEWEKSKSKK